MSGKLTPEQIDESYKLGLQAYKEEKSVKDAIIELANDSLPNRRINENTGGTLIRGFKKMMEGIGIENSIFADTLRVYLQNIYDDSNYGDEQVEICLNAIENFFNEYPHYKDDNRCEVHDDFSNEIGKKPIYNIKGDEQNASSEEKGKRSNELAGQFKTGIITEQEALQAFNALYKDEIAKYLRTGQGNIAPSKYSNQYIVRIHEHNHRKVPSWGYRGYEMLKYLEPISYEDYRRLGNRYRDIRSEVNNRHVMLFDSKEEADAYCDSMGAPKKELAIGKLLKESWLVDDTDNYKIGWARKNSEGHPLDLYEADPYTWQDWVQHRPKNNAYNRKYVFTLVQFYHEPDTWIFSGVFEVLGEENGKYKMRVTNELKEHIGRLKISHGYNTQSPRTNMEPYYSEFVVKEILDDPYFIIAEDSKTSESEDDMEIMDTATDYTLKDIVEDGCFVEEGKLANMLQRIKEKKNFILQGPPGTGKTWLAKRLGYALIGKKDKRQVMSVQFHPNMSYEDFVMGYRPDEGGTLKKSNGIFMEFVQKAHENPNESYVMVIEEINRGNPAQIFGEMLTLLEADKRNPDEKLRLCYQDEFEVPIYIPKNFYVIGTMNLADRSLAVVDFALRRRFAFVDLEPELNHLWLRFAQNRFSSDESFAQQIQARMKVLNDKIKSDPSLGKQFCIGHSFVTPTHNIANPKAWFSEIVRTEIRPLLEEYWFDAIETGDDGEATTTKTQSATDELLSGL